MAIVSNPYLVNVPIGTVVVLGAHPPSAATTRVCTLPTVQKRSAVLRELGWRLPAPAMPPVPGALAPRGRKVAVELEKPQPIDAQQKGVTTFEDFYLSVYRPRRLKSATARACRQHAKTVGLFSTIPGAAGNARRSYRCDVDCVGEDGN